LIAIEISPLLAPPDTHPQGHKLPKQLKMPPDWVEGIEDGVTQQ
jgi:hypothetical protein